MSSLARFFRLPIADKAMLCEATALTAFARLALLCVPFRRIAPCLGQQQAVSPECQSSGDHEVVQRVRAAIRIASRRVPWKTKCLAQAIVAAIMLRRRRIDGTVYLGIGRNQQVIAHAWLRSGQTIVTGAQGREGLTVLATFAWQRQPGGNS